MSQTSNSGDNARTLVLRHQLQVAMWNLLEGGGSGAMIYQAAHEVVFDGLPRPNPPSAPPSATQSVVPPANIIEIRSSTGSSPLQTVNKIRELRESASAESVKGKKVQIIDPTLDPLTPFKSGQRQIGTPFQSQAKLDLRAAEIKTAGNRSIDKALAAAGIDFAGLGSEYGDKASVSIPPRSQMGHLRPSSSASTSSLVMPTPSHKPTRAQPSNKKSALKKKPTLKEQAEQQLSRATKRLQAVDRITRGKEF